VRRWSTAARARSCDGQFLQPTVRVTDDGRLLLCASVEQGVNPSSGQAAVLARMQSRTADGQRLQVVLAGVRHATLGAVREDVQKEGLWYARTAAVAGINSVTSAPVAGGCCTIC